MQYGIDRLYEAAFAPLTGRRVGLFTNLSAVSQDLTPTYTLFRHASQRDAVRLVALFGPEHGFSAAAAEGAGVGAGTDPLTGLPVFSLYGPTLRPTPDMLTGLDIMVCDIQDIGVRYYRYLWTLTHILEACGEHGIPVMILDRPNPLGAGMDGGPLDPALASLVGRWSIPVQHGLTLGELARMLNAVWNPTPAEVEVLPCSGWRRALRWPDLNRVFVPPSPNMPHFSTAAHYPGACLLEGTILSEGRGTPLPFEVVGAPFVDALALADALNALELPGVRFRPHHFSPASGKFAGLTCGGVQAHITGPTYRSLVGWLAVLYTIRRLYPADFAWLPPFEGVYHFDRLIGSSQPRAVFAAGLTLPETLQAIMSGWEAFQQAFWEQSAPYRLYD